MKTGLQIVKKDDWIPEGLRAKLAGWSPKSHLGAIVRECLRFLPVELAADLIDRISATVVIESSLALVVFRHRDSARKCGLSLVEDYGIVSRRLVTTAGVNYIVDAFQNSVELENFKFHGIGTGSLAEATGDTALGAELTTQYNPDNTRATGNLAEGASSNIFHTEGTNTLDANGVVLREHGVFTQAAAPGGTLLDRSVFAAITLDSGDALLSKYELTANAGG
ncbi:MAG: hypothetical protein AB1631_23480 [Acidobacteriota bacterium]